MSDKLNKKLKGMTYSQIVQRVGVSR